MLIVYNVYNYIETTCKCTCSLIFNVLYVCIPPLLYISGRIFHNLIMENQKKRGVLPNITYFRAKIKNSFDS